MALFPATLKTPTALPSATATMAEESNPPLSRLAPIPDKEARKPKPFIGVTDIHRYLDENPDFCRQAAAMIEVRDVNEKGFQIWGTHNGELFDKIYGKLAERAGEKLAEVSMEFRAVSLCRSPESTSSM